MATPENLAAALRTAAMAAGERRFVGGGWCRWRHLTARLRRRGWALAMSADLVIGGKWKSSEISGGGGVNSGVVVSGVLRSRA